MAGRTPRKKSSASKKIWPSVMEMTYSFTLKREPRLLIIGFTYVRRDVCRHITTLSLDDRESGERPATKLLVHLGRTLEETRVEVEDITRVGLTSRGTTEK
jgi:hypothetical protein